MIGVTELRAGTTFKLDGQLLVVLKYEHIKMGRGSGTVKVKVKNLDTGAVVEKSFITGARVESIEMQHKEATYLYKSGEDLVLMDDHSYEQFEINSKILGEQGNYLQE